MHDLKPGTIGSNLFWRNSLWRPLHLQKGLFHLVPSKINSSTSIYHFQEDGTVQLIGTKGQKFSHCPGTKGQQDKLKILPRAGTACQDPKWDVGWDGRKFWQSVTSCRTKQDRAEKDILKLEKDVPKPEKKRSKTGKWSFKTGNFVIFLKILSAIR